ncbi:amino acid ABC transporter substrate-binding protein [Actinomycetaceae bacterium TAE3-ERU4]|nr:amino acid ABC transporter substrate-binding protein [Actinomycetaceae bacterium TAE3-ERU4]
MSMQNANESNLESKGLRFAHHRTALVLAALVPLALTGCSSSAKPVGSAMDKETLVVGYDNTFVPMGFTEAGKPVGFDVELAREFARRNGKKVEFKNIDWSLKEAELDSGKIDLIWNGYSSTPERLKKVGASKPYLKNSQIILVRKDSDVKAKSDLAGKKVGTQAASTGEEALSKDSAFLSSLEGGKANTYSTYDQAMRDLQVGRISAVVGDSVLLNYYAKLKGSENFRVLPQTLGEEEYVIAFRKDDKKTKSALDKFVDEISADGTLAKTSQRWFG